MQSREGSSPIISYNYGAHRYKRVKQAAVTMGIMALIYTLLAWLAIILAPEFLISIFSSDKSLLADAVPAMKLYFGAFIFMLLQYIGQTIFKSLNKKKQAIFFSVCKVIIVIPMTYLLRMHFIWEQTAYSFGRTNLSGHYRRQPVLSRYDNKHTQRVT